MGLFVKLIITYHIKEEGFITTLPQCHAFFQFLFFHYLQPFPPNNFSNASNVVYNSVCHTSQTSIPLTNDVIHEQSHNDEKTQEVTLMWTLMFGGADYLNLLTEHIIFVKRKIKNFRK
jgi:hypothetical protein